MIFIFTNDRDDARYEDSIQVLFEENYDRAYNTAIAILSNKDLAKDAVQEAFSRALLKINTLNDKSKFSAWICSITKNICRDMLRQINRQNGKNTSIYDEDGDVKNITELSDFNVPEIIYEDKEIRQEIKDCMDELDADSQQVINLRFFEELTYEEIAEHMNISVNTVKVKLYRAKQRMADKLRKHFDTKGSEYRHV
jgi:RNA polymerase sigma-70 factor (ECF subfamily)